MKMPIDSPGLQRTTTQTGRLALSYLTSRLSVLFWTWLARSSLALWGASVGPGLVVRGRMRIHNGGQLRIADHVRINSGAANYVGGDRRMALWVSSTGSLAIGRGCAISNSTIMCRHRVVLGEEVFVGGGCEIYDNDFHQLDPIERTTNSGPIGHGPIEIGSQAFIGAGTMILKNVTIGKGAVVGAGSVVTKSIPAFEVWAGVPARFVRKLNVADDPGSRGDSTP